MGTVINVRRSRYNVLSRTTDKAYLFGENGIQAKPAKTNITNGQGELTNSFSKPLFEHNQYNCE